MYFSINFIFIHQFYTFPAKQAGTSWGESSKPDLILNFILKVRMLRLLRHSRLKRRKSSFWGKNIVFGHFGNKNALFAVMRLSSLRTEDWGFRIQDLRLRTEDRGLRSEDWRFRTEDWGLRTNVKNQMSIRLIFFGRSVPPEFPLVILTIVVAFWSNIFCWIGILVLHYG